VHFVDHLREASGECAAVARVVDKPPEESLRTEVAVSVGCSALVPRRTEALFSTNARCPLKS